MPRQYFEGNHPNVLPFSHVCALTFILHVDGFPSKYCHGTSFPLLEWSCHDGRRCIGEEYDCDGWIHCGDGSDTMIGKYI